jgi:hypothetical protein
MGPWVVRELIADAIDPNRWLVTFNVPAEFAGGGGIYSMSIPRDLMNHWAPAYGYNISNPDDIDELFEHIIYYLYLMEIDNREKNASGGAAPLAVTMSVPRSVREITRERIAALKEVAPIVQNPPPPAPEGASLRSASVSTNVLGDLKADMISRIDPEQVALVARGLL